MKKLKPIKQNENSNEKKQKNGKNILTEIINWKHKKKREMKR